MTELEMKNSELIGKPIELSHFKEKYVLSKGSKEPSFSFKLTPTSFQVKDWVFEKYGLSLLNQVRYVSSEKEVIYTIHRFSDSGTFSVIKDYFGNTRIVRNEYLQLVTGTSEVERIFGSDLPEEESEFSQVYFGNYQRNKDGVLEPAQEL